MTKQGWDSITRAIRAIDRERDAVHSAVNDTMQVGGDGSEVGEYGPPGNIYPTHSPNFSPFQLFTVNYCVYFLN